MLFFVPWIHLFLLQIGCLSYMCVVFNILKWGFFYPFLWFQDNAFLWVLDTELICLYLYCGAIWDAHGSLQWCRASHDLYLAAPWHLQPTLRVTRENFTHTSSSLALLELPWWLFSGVITNTDFPQSLNKEKPCHVLECSTNWGPPDSGIAGKDGWLSGH